MSLGENLQFLRKRDNITQEQLAEKLEVSRQSVSKWESDITYPEMDKLLLLCQMFHCSIDDLVQGNIKNIYVEDKTEYDDHMNRFSKYIAFGIAVILSGMAAMFLLYGMNYFIGGGMEVIKENFTEWIFLIFLTPGVAILIVTGIQHENFIKKNPFVENFYTQKEIDVFNKKFPIMIAAGVSAILIGIIISTGIPTVYPEFDANEYLESLLSFFLIICITVGVIILVYGGIQKSKYDIDAYNKSHDRESAVYKKNELTGKVCASIMMVAVIIYLIMGFCYRGWHGNAIIVFVIGGILCGIASIIINSSNK